MPSSPIQEASESLRSPVGSRSPAPRFKARSLALVYVLVTFAMSWSLIWGTTMGLPVQGYLFLVILMWIPGTVAIVFRIIFGEGFEDAGFHAGRLRHWLIAVGAPLALASVTYLIAWFFGQVHITPYLKQQSMYGPLPFRLVWFNAEASTLALLAHRFGIVLTLGVGLGFLTGLGEEIGWRGYLLPRLIKAKVRFPILWTGVIWATWHMPFVLLTFQHERYATAGLYWVLCVVVAVFIGWLRLNSGSVFVAGMAHGAYNTFYQDFYDHSFAGTHKWFWAGDVGLLCSLTFGVLALWLYGTGRISRSLQQSSR
jgi:membrane protease YdiL (CAAX protease family)